MVSPKMSRIVPDSFNFLLQIKNIKKFFIGSKKYIIYSPYFTGQPGHFRAERMAGNDW